MTYDPFDVLIIRIGRRFRAGQHILGIEDVKPLVLHGPHVEMANRNNHVEIEVVFAAKPFLIPAHRIFEGFQCMAAFIDVLGFSKNL